MVTVATWRVHDSGLVAAPSRFRRLGGQVRHHRGEGDAWPTQVDLELLDAELVATARGTEIGRWPTAEITARQMSEGPPVTFVLEIPGAPQLLAAAADASTTALLAALGH